MQALRRQVGGYEVENRPVSGTIWALGQIGAPAVEPLTAALQDENEDVQEAAAEALRQVKSDLAGFQKPDRSYILRNIQCPLTISGR